MTRYSQKFLNYIKSLWQNAPILPYPTTLPYLKDALKALIIKTGFYFFLSPSDMQTLRHYLGCHTLQALLIRLTIF